MDTKIKPKINTFKTEVFEGLSSFPKHLSSKYFYDKKGDRLFQEIMAMPEYYLTGCEFEILSTNTKTIGELFEIAKMVWT